MVSLGKQALFLGDRLEQATISFTTMLGSAEEAKQLLSDLTDFAKKTPFEILGLRDTAKQLLAFGIESQKVIPTLKMIGDVAAGLSVPIEQIAYAYGQVRTANQLYGTELRQFVNAGVPLLSELAKMYGVTEAAAKKMVEDGLVSFADVEEAFRRMSSEGGRFFNLMEKQSGSLTGQISNLKDSFNQTMEIIGTALIPVAKSLVGVLRTVVSGIQGFVQNIGTLGPIMLAAIVGIGLL